MVYNIWLEKKLLYERESAPKSPNEKADFKYLRMCSTTNGVTHETTQYNIVFCMVFRIVNAVD